MENLCLDRVWLDAIQIHIKKFEMKIFELLVFLIRHQYLIMWRVVLNVEPSRLYEIGQIQLANVSTGNDFY